MTQDENCIIWLVHRAGETLLGLSATQADLNTRFRILGKMREPAFHVGVWVDIDMFEQLTLGHPSIVMQSWIIKPPTCLIRWEFVAYIQRGESPPAPEIGFTLVPNK